MGILSRARHVFVKYVLDWGGKMRNLPARLRAAWYVGVRLADGEICYDCGRPVSKWAGSWWKASDQLWERVNGHAGGIKCQACFVQRCHEKCITVYWMAVTEPYDRLRHERGSSVTGVTEFTDGDRDSWLRPR